MAKIVEVDPTIPLLPLDVEPPPDQPVDGGVGVKKKATIIDVPPDLPLDPIESKPLYVQAWNSLDDTVRLLANGAAFGYADEFAGFMNSAFGPGVATAGDADKIITEWFGGKEPKALKALSYAPTYEEGHEAERAKMDAIRAREPWAAFTAEMVGGLGTSIPGAGAAMKSVEGSGKLAKILVGGLVGGTAGAVAGSGESPDDRVSGALIGAGVGTTLGIAIPLAKDAVVGVVKRFLTKTSERDARAAVEKVLVALERDDITPDEAFAKLQGLGPEARLIDAGGENLLGVGRAVAGAPGGGKQIAKEFLDARQAGQGKRVVDAVNNFLDPAGDFAKTADDLNVARQTNAKPLYEVAYKTPVKPTDDLVNIFNRPAMRQAFARAQKIAQNEGEDIPELFIKDGKGVILNAEALKDVKVLDYVKRGLDDIVERNTDDLTGKIKGEVARGVNKLRKEYVALLDEVSPDYRAAREAWGGPSRSLEMMGKGRRFARADEDITVAQLKEMTEDERFFFRLGSARALRDMIYNTPDGADAVKRIFGSKLKRDRISALFPDEQSFNEFSDLMQREATLYETRVVGPRAGSPTSPRAQELQDLQEVGTAGAWLAVGNQGPALVGLMKTLFGHGARDMSSDQAMVLARVLFQNSPETNRKILDALLLSRHLANISSQTSGVLAAEGGLASGRAVEQMASEE